MASLDGDPTIDRLVALLVVTHSEAHADADLAWRAQDLTRRVHAALFESEILGESTPLRAKAPPVEANAYRRWSAEDDQRLRELAAGGASTEKIAAEFARKPSAIQSRLAKLALQDLGWIPATQPREVAPTAVAEQTERDPEP